MAKQSPAVETTEEQKRIEELAAELARQIKERVKPQQNEKGETEKSYRDVEYIGVVYRDGDTLRISTIYTKNELAKAPWEKAFAEAGGVQNVVAVVHNHPAEIGRSGENSLTYQANKLPSDNDWNAAKSWFGDRTDPTLYVLGPDDRLRRYPYVEAEKWRDRVNDDPYDKDGYRANPGPTVKIPNEPPAWYAAPTPDQASLQSQALYAQAQSNQLPSMQAYPEEQRQQMAGYAAFVAAERGWNGIAGIGMNNATATQKAGDLLCIAGKSDNPDPHANGVAVPPDQAMKAAPGEWLAQADTARQTLAQTQAQAQQLTQTQEQSQSVEQGMAHRRVL